ncbi:MAG: hypothetical protein V2A73_18065 [Pseudomonadota bacterium]
MKKTASATTGLPESTGSIATSAATGSIANASASLPANVPANVPMNVPANAPTSSSASTGGGTRLIEISADEPRALARARRAARHASRVVHANVCRARGVSKNEGHLYLVTDPVPAEDLGRLVQRGERLSWPLFSTLARDIGSALVEAHRLGVVHGALSLAAIRLVDGRFVLADLGLEQARHDEPLDERDDVLGFGAVLYEALTGLPPLQAPADRLPFQLRASILRCLQPDRERRFGTIVEALHSLGVEVKTDLRRGMKGGRFGWRSFAHAGALALAVLGGALGAYWLSTTGSGSEYRRQGAGRTALPTVAESAAPSLRTADGGILAGEPRLTNETAKRSNRRLLVAIAPFKTNGVDPANAWLGTGMRELLVMALGEIPGVESVSLNQSPAAGKGKQTWADYFIEGEIVESRESRESSNSSNSSESSESPPLSIVVRLNDLAHDAVRLADRLSVSSTPEGVLAGATLLGQKLFRALGVLSGFPIPTESLTALQSYVAAQSSPDPTLRENRLRRAVELDSHFVHARLALCRFLFQTGRAVEGVRLAVESMAIGMIGTAGDGSDAQSAGRANKAGKASDVTESSESSPLGGAGGVGGVGGVGASRGTGHGSFAGAGNSGVVAALSALAASSVEERISILQALAKEKPSDAALALDLVAAYRDAGQGRECLAEAQRASGLDRTTVALVLRDSVWCAMLIGDHQTALTKARELEVKLGLPGTEAMGDVLLMLGRYQAARQAYAKAATADGSSSSNSNSNSQYMVAAKHALVLLHGFGRCREATQLASRTARSLYSGKPAGVAGESVVGTQGLAPRAAMTAAAAAAAETVALIWSAAAALCRDSSALLEVKRWAEQAAPQAADEIAVAAAVAASEPGAYERSLARALDHRVWVGTWERSRRYGPLLAAVSVDARVDGRSDEALRTVGLPRPSDRYPFLGRPLLFDIALARIDTGDLDEAALACADLASANPSYAPAYYCQGRVAEARGAWSEAFVGYRAFLDRWSDASDANRWVTDARRRLAGILAKRAQNQSK